MSLFLFLLVSGVGCGFCLWLFLDYLPFFRSLFWIRIFLLMKPNVWFAFLKVLCMCVLHERSSDIVTPRYLTDGTFFSSIPCKRYLVGIGVLSRVTWMTWYFEGLKFMSRSFSQCSRLARACWRIICEQTYTGFDLVR